MVLTKTNLLKPSKGEGTYQQRSSGINTNSENRVFYKSYRAMGMYKEIFWVPKRPKESMRLVGLQITESETKFVEYS